MPEGVLKGSWTPCPKARIEGGNGDPPTPKGEFKLVELRLTPVSPKAEFAQPLTVTGRRGGGRCQDPHV